MVGENPCYKVEGKGRESEEGEGGKEIGEEREGKGD